MSTFETARTGLLWDATSVPNAFFCEFMPAAPDGYVKVYLYGLMLTRSGVADNDGFLNEISKALQMEPTEIEYALRYWERNRLVERLQDNPPRYRFTSVVLTQLGREYIPRDEKYESFAQSLYAVFGDRRKIHGSESALAYEWVEKEGLPPEIVLMLIHYMISTHGINFSFKTAQRVAVTLREQKVETVEHAEMIFSRSEAAMQAARKVLNHLSISRNPTMDETDLYIKWTTEWKFTPKAIIEACKETTSSYTPSFAYLDKILEGLYNRSNGAKLTEKHVQKSLTDENALQSQIREVLHALGLTRAIIDDGVKTFYLNLLAKGDHAWIMHGAQLVGRRKDPSLDSLQRVLDTWIELGLTTVDSVNLYLDEIKRLNDELRLLMKKAGADSGRTQANRSRLKRWKDEWRMPQALIELAAEMAFGKKDIGAYMHKLLSVWHEDSIFSVEEVHASHDRYLAKKHVSSEESKKRVIEQFYEQRSYDPAELDGITPEQLEEMNKL